MGHLQNRAARWVEIFNEFRSISLVKSFVFKWHLSIYDSFQEWVRPHRLKGMDVKLET